MVLAQKQILRPVEQSTKPTYESTQPCPPGFLQRSEKHTMEKKQLLQQMFLGKMDLCMQETETRSMSFTL
jgi:hypothetical protein